MTDIAEFIAARLDEDERVALAATEGPWEVDDVQYAETIRAADGVSPVAGSRWGGEASVFETTEDAIHIARHDPARVLADVTSKRAVLARLATAADLCPADDWPDDGDMMKAPVSDYARHLLVTWAQLYADHPDFDPSWRNTPGRPS